jgi:hypothetical protein
VGIGRKVLTAIWTVRAIQIGPDLWSEKTVDEAESAVPKSAWCLDQLMTMGTELRVTAGKLILGEEAALSCV